MTKWISNFPGWILDQLGIVNRGGDYKPYLLDTVVPVVIIEETETGALDADSENAFGVRINVGLVAAQLAHAQVKNPAASPKTTFVDSMIILNTNAAAETFFWGMKDADLTTLVATVNPKDSDGGSGSTQARTQNNAADLLDSIFGAISVGPNLSSPQIMFNPPVRLSAGSGFAVRGITLNQSLQVSLELREYVDED